MRGGGGGRRRRRVIDGFELYDACDGRERGVSWDTVVATHAMTMTMGEVGDGRGLGTTRPRVRVRVRGRVVMVRESDDDGDGDDVAAAHDASDGVIDDDVLSCSLVVGVESDEADQKGCKESRGGFFVNVSDGPYELGAPSERYRTMYAKRFTRAYDLACRLMRALNRNSRVRFDAIVREILIALRASAFGLFCHRQCL